MKIARNVLKAASLAMAVKDVRFYLVGMLIECNGRTARLVATDGDRMHIADAHQATPCAPLAAPVIVPRALIEWALKNSKPGQSIELTATPQPPVGSAPVPPLITVTAGGASMSGPAIDGVFPDYSRVIPRTPPSGKVAQFNPRYVLDAYTAVIEFAGSKPGENIVTLQHDGPNAAGFMAYGDSGRGAFVAIIMPWRGAASMAGIDDSLLASLPAAD